MPASSTRPAALSRAIPWAMAAVLCAVPVAGCRALRCQQVSDEAIASARQLSLQGFDAQQRGRWDLAESLFATAVIKCPTDERARCGYAESLWHRGARAEAVSHMEQAARLSGNDPERLVQLGHMYREQGDLARAAQQADRAITANPQLAQAWALRGEVERASGRPTAALAGFHRALALQPHFPPVQLAVSEIYMAENRPQQALATLQALGNDFPPGQAPLDLLVRQSSALRNMGRHADAARTLAAAAERGNPSADLLLALAQVQAAIGDVPAARLALDAALAREPQHPACLAFARELGLQPGTLANFESPAPAGEFRR